MQSMTTRSSPVPLRNSNRPEARWEVHSVEEACEVVAIGAKSGTCGGCLPMPSCEAPPDCGDNVNGLKMCRPCFDYAGNPDLKPPMKGMPDCANINSEKQALSGGSGISGTGPQPSLLQAFAKRAAKK